MRFDFERNLKDNASVFYVSIRDAELEINGHDERLIRRFINLMLNRVACQIAGYYFKKYKNEYEQFVNSDECKNMIAKELANKITLEIK